MKTNLSIMVLGILLFTEANAAKLTAVDLNAFLQLVRDECSILRPDKKATIEEKWAAKINALPLHDKAEYEEMTSSSEFASSYKMFKEGFAKDFIAARCINLINDLDK